MRLLLTELRANLYIEYSTQAVTPKAPKAPLSSDDKFMESTHLLQLPAAARRGASPRAAAQTASR